MSTRVFSFTFYHTIYLITSYNHAHLVLKLMLRKRSSRNSNIRFHRQKKVVNFYIINI